MVAETSQEDYRLKLSEEEKRQILYMDSDLDKDKTLADNRPLKVEIDSSSGFCFGVTTAISKAEEELSRGRLYCLGDIVHNSGEVDRLHAKGLETINHDTFRNLHNAKVLLRAHGEPPATYDIAKHNAIEIIDATCPVVLQLQKRIRKVYESSPHAQIVIYGKRGHAEVLGLVGQTAGKAIIVENIEEAEKTPLNYNHDIYLFSQTTKSLDGFHKLKEFFLSHIQPPAQFHAFDTICRQVANRQPVIERFAERHDVVIFVCGKKSSNGHALYEACRRSNPRSYMVDSPSSIELAWFNEVNSVGICGATSTPKWLMEACRDEIFRLTKK